MSGNMFSGGTQSYVIGGLAAVAVLALLVWYLT